MNILIKNSSIKYMLCYLILLLTNSILMWNFNLSNKDNYVNILILSWYINFIVVISGWIMYKTLGNSIGLQHIVILICFLFNFGQTFLWSLGVHSDNEIGTTKLFSNYRIPTNKDIYNALVFSEYCFVLLIFGMIVFSGFTIKRKSKNGEDNANIFFDVLYRVSVILGWVVIPLTFVRVFITLFFSAFNGYSALYYSSFQIPAILDFAEKLFFPVVVGILVGSRYKKIRVAYVIFALFVILYSLSGERGNWIYDLLVLIWMHHKYYKKINFMKILKLSIVAFVSLYIVAAIVDLRQYGLMNITFNELLETFIVGNSPIIRFLMEMGQSLGVTIMVLGYGRDVFPFTNSFGYSILGSVSTELARLIGIPVVYLSNYFSQDVLKITYGTGFNFFAETYINGSVIYMFIWGAFIQLILSNYKNQNSEFRKYVGCIVTPIICSCFRGESLAVFKNIVQIGILYPLILFGIFKLVMKKKNEMY